MDHITQKIMNDDAALSKRLAALEAVALTKQAGLPESEGEKRRCKGIGQRLRNCLVTSGRQPPCQRLVAYSRNSVPDTELSRLPMTNWSARQFALPSPCLRISALVRDEADPDQNPVPCTYVTVVT